MTEQPQSADSVAGPTGPVRPSGVSFGHRLRNWFLTGIVVLAPIGLTVYLTVAFVTFVDRNVAGLLPDQYHPDRYLPVSIPGTGVVIALLGLTLIGFLTTNIIGRALLRWSERMVERMPVIRSIYGASKQVLETVFAQSTTSFRQVVLVEFPRAGMWTIAFVSTEKGGEVSRRTGEDLIGVYVPTTPNPTSGYFVYVRRNDAIPLSMTVEDAMKVVISCGVVAVPDRGQGPLPPAAAQPERK